MHNSHRALRLPHLWLALLSVKGYAIGPCRTYTRHKPALACHAPLCLHVLSQLLHRPCDDVIPNAPPQLPDYDVCAILIGVSCGVHSHTRTRRLVQRLIMWTICS